MGLFSFIKNAGAKLFNKNTAAETAAENAEAGAKLEQTIRDMGFNVEDLTVQIEGENAKIYGTVESQEIREKVILLVGNTEGIGQVDDRLDVAVEEPESQFHTVVSGDSLSKIAKAYYGDAMKYPVIFEANKPMLSDPNKIYPGQMLRIPAL